MVQNKLSYFQVCHTLCLTEHKHIQCFIHIISSKLTNRSVSSFSTIQEVCRVTELNRQLYSQAQWALPPSRAILWHINWNKLGILLSLSTININTSQPVDWDVCGKVLRDLSLLYCTFSIPVLLLWTFSSGKNQFNLANLYSVPLFAIHLFYLSHTELRLTGYRCHPGLILRYT